jgi:hypothetical protein
MINLFKELTLQKQKLVLEYSIALEKSGVKSSLVINYSQADWASDKKVYSTRLRQNTLIPVC